MVVQVYVYLNRQESFLGKWVTHPKLLILNDKLHYKALGGRTPIFDLVLEDTAMQKPI